MKLQAKNLTKKYLGKVVVDRLNITLKPGEILGLLGPNGAGKTTFFLYDCRINKIRFWKNIN